MKKQWLLSVFIFLVSLSHSVFGACDVIHVSGGSHWVPYSFLEARAEMPKGIAVDVIEEVAKTLQIPLKYHYGLPWNRMMKLLDQGKIDLVLGSYWTKERAQKYLYTLSFADDEVRIFTRVKNSFEFSNPPDLVGKKGAVLRGISLGDRFERYRDQLTLIQVETHEQSLRMLDRGRVDYVIAPMLVAQINLNRLGLDKKIEPLSVLFATNSVYLMMSRESPCRSLLLSIDAILQDLLAQGRIQTMTQRYTQVENP